MARRAHALDFDKKRNDYRLRNWTGENPFAKPKKQHHAATAPTFTELIEAYCTFRVRTHANNPVKAEAVTRRMLKTYFRGLDGTDRSTGLASNTCWKYVTGLERSSIRLIARRTPARHLSMDREKRERQGQLLAVRAIQPRTSSYMTSGDTNLRDGHFCSPKNSCVSTTA